MIEDGGDEDEAIAALLHHLVEDQGGAARLPEIEARFGAQVAGWVAALGEGDVDAAAKAELPWRERRERVIRRYAEAGPPVARIALADKRHDARAIVRDLEVLGPAAWERFDAGADDQLWYHRGLVDALARGGGPMADGFAALVGRMEDPTRG